MSAPPPMPERSLRVRHAVCAQCPTPCAHQADDAFRRDPCSQCPLPRKRFGQYGRCANYGKLVEETARAALKVTFLPGKPPEPVDPLRDPTVKELAVNFGGAMVRWTKAGFPTISEDVYAARAAACEACPHWDGAARLGLGKCKAPGCGCTKFKRWLATEKCPLGKWP